MRGHIQKDLEYRISISDFEICIKKLEGERDALLKRIDILGYEYNSNLEEQNRKLNELNEINSNLNEELDKY